MSVKGAIIPSAFGFSVNGAGDINGDNVDDIIIGALSESYTGAAYVIFGSKGISSAIELNAVISDPEKGFRMSGRSMGVSFSISVSGAGDINSDGINDIMVGSSGENANAGVAYILFSQIVCPDNCESCKTSDKCLTCKTGFGLDKNSKCAVCPDNCLTCETTEKCLTCKTGFGLEKDQCIVCPALTELINGICTPKKTSLETATQVSEGLFDSGSTASRVFTMGRSLSVGLGLMAKIIQNVRYLNISYPPETLSAFESYGTDMFELPIPETFYESPETKDLPSQYTRYDIDPSFLENYWQTFMTILMSLGGFLIIRLFQYLTRKQKKDHAIQITLKNLGQTAANFLVIQIYSNLDDVIFYFLLDASSTKMSSPSAGLSLGAAICFLLIGLALVVVHCWVLGRYQKAKAQDQLESFKEKFRFLGTLYEDFKDDNAVKQSFFGILILRCIFLVLVIMLLQPPWIQTSLLMLAHLIFLGYMIYQRPFKSRFDEYSQYFCEATIFAAYLSALVLSILDYQKNFTSSVRNGFGKCIVLAGIVLSLGGFVIQVIQIIGVIREIYYFLKESMKKKEQKRVPISKALELSKNARKISADQKQVLKSTSILQDHSSSSQIELSGILKKNLTLPKVVENPLPNLSVNESEISFMNTAENVKMIDKTAPKRTNSDITPLNNKDVLVLEAEEIKVAQNPLRDSQMEEIDLNEGETYCVPEDTSRTQKKKKKFKVKPRLPEMPNGHIDMNEEL